MYTVILLSVSIFFAVANNAILHSLNNKGLRGIGDVLLFNAFVSLIWILILSILNKGFNISAVSWLWGIIYGSVTAAFLLCKMKAMSTGPASVTSFIGCSSLLISTAFGLIYFNEKVTAVQIIGVVLLITALFLTTAKSGSLNSINAEKSWFIWCILFFLCSGTTGIIFKLHQSSTARGEVNQMMLAAAITSTALFFASSFFMKLKNKSDKWFLYISVKIALFVVICGIVSCGYNRINITLSGMLPSIIFFPLFNGSVIFLTSLAAVAIFREKITKCQTMGISIGIIALLLASAGGR